MNRKEALRSLGEIATSPAAAWIGNRLSEDGARLIQKCLRCGTEETRTLPTSVVEALRIGAHGTSLAYLVPEGLDEELFAWKKTFQRAHEGCGWSEAA